MSQRALSDGTIPHRGARSSWRCAAAILLIVHSSYDVSSGDDQTPHATGVGLREAFVPADEPEVWPQGEWIPRPTRLYRQIVDDLARHQNTPPPAEFSRARYTAVLEEEHFLRGNFTADVLLRGTEATYLSLGEPRCALSELSWDDRPAQWGLTPDSRTLLRVDTHADVLQGAWSLRGREFFGRVEFDVALLPAAITTLELKLPVTKHLSADDSVSVRPRAEEGTEWRTWVLEAGRQSQFRLVISDDPDSFSRVSPQVDRVSRYTLNPDGLTFRTDFQVEGAGSNEQLRIPVTPEMEISSVTLGTELELPFRRVPHDGGAAESVVIPLDSVYLEGRIKLGVTGSMPIPVDGRVSLPRISLDGFPIASSRLQIAVQRPLELRDYTATSCRLLFSTSTRQQSDQLELEDWAADSEVSLVCAVPDPDVIADVAGAVDAHHSHPIARTVMKLTTRSGSTYELTCRVPRGWQVTRVTSESWHSASTIASWDTAQTADGATELWIELRNALTQETPVILEVWATRTTESWNPAADLPIIIPRASGLRRVCLSMRPPTGSTFSLPPSSSFRQLRLTEMQNECRRLLPNWDDWFREVLPDAASADDMLYLTSDAPSPSESLLVLPKNGTSTATDGQLRTSPQSPPSDRISEPHRKAPTEVDGLLADVVLETRASDAPGQPCMHRAVFRLPRPATGTVLEFTVPEPAEMVSATVDDDTTHARLTGRSARIQVPGGREPIRIELEYRTLWNYGFLSSRGHVPVPRSEVSVASLQWRLTLPRTFRVQASTSGSSLTTSPVRWQQRLLGPLASTHSTFWPFSAVSEGIADSAERDPPAEGILVDTSPSPTDEGTQTVSRSLAFSQQDLHLEIWREDRARHLAWVLLGIAAVGTLLIRRRLRHRVSLILLGWLAISGTTAFLIPDALAVPAGGVFLGALIGVVFPLQAPIPERVMSRWFGRHDLPSVGSTRSFAGAGAPIIALAIIAASRAFAVQIESTPTAAPLGANSTEQTQEYDVLIPVENGSPTLDDTPVVYVRPTVLARWKAVRSESGERPPYLIREATYVITTDYQSRPRVSAAFDVVVQNPEASQQIVLPLNGIVIDESAPCRVNGRATTVIPLRDGAGILVEVPASTGSSLPEDEQENPSLRDQVSETPLRIELAFRPHAGERRNQETQFEIPRILSSVVEFRDLRQSVGTHGYGAILHQEESRVVRAEVGPIRTVELGKRTEESGASPSIVPDTVLTWVDVHPRRLGFRSRFQCRPNPEADRQRFYPMELLLPPRAIVSNVQAPDLIHSTVITRSGHPTQLQLAIASLPAEPFELNVQYSLSVETPGTVVPIPALPQGEGTRALSFPKQVVALSARSGFQISLGTTELADEGITVATPGQFMQLWGSGEDASPHAAYSLTAPVPVHLTVTPIASDLTASIRESLTVEHSMLRWVADVEIESRAAPVAVHRLQVDPRLRLTSVRVSQNGADRLVRWSRISEKEVTLLLTEDLIGSQSLRVAGDLPFPPNDAIDLPEFSLPRAHIAHQEIEIRSPAGWQVTPLDGGGMPLTNPAGTLPSSPAKATLESTATYDLMTDSRPMKVRVRESSGAFPYERIVIVSPQAADQWRVKTFIRFPENALLPSRIEFSVPSEWTQWGPLTTIPELESSRSEAGTTYVLDSRDPQSFNRVVAFSVMVRSPAVDHWTISPIQVPQGAPVAERLVLFGEAPYEIGGSVRATDLSDDLLALISPVGEPVGAKYRAFQSDSPNWSFSLRPAGTLASHVTRMESAIWDELSGTLAGITTADVSLRRTMDIRVPLPPGTKLLMATWDDVALRPPDDPADALDIPPDLATPQSQPHRLKLWWQHKASKTSIRREVPLPQIAQLPVSKELAVFLGTTDRLYEWGGPWVPLKQRDSSESPPPSGLLEQPINDALVAAGHAAGMMTSSGAMARPSTMVLVGPSSDDRAAPAASTIKVWSVGRGTFRVTLVSLLVAVCAFVLWKAKPGNRMPPRFFTPATRLCAGPVLLALLLWTMGPGHLGFALLLLCTFAWGMLTWQAKAAETSFVMSTDRTP